MRDVFVLNQTVEGLSAGTEVVSATNDEDLEEGFDWWVTQRGMNTEPFLVDPSMLTKRRNREDIVPKPTREERRGRLRR